MRESSKRLDPFTEQVLRGEHPRLEGIPDHGLTLGPEDEADFRALAERSGIDFDEIKYRFELSHQVVPAQSDRKIAKALVRNRIIPQNSVKDYILGQLHMAITIKNTPNYWNRSKVPE